MSSTTLAQIYTRLSGNEIDTLHCTHITAVNSAFIDWMHLVAKHNGGLMPHSPASIEAVCEQIRLYILRSGRERTIEYINAGKRHEIVDLDAHLYYPYNPNFRYLQRTSRANRAQVTVNRPRVHLKATATQISNSLQSIGV
jgi:hypothetical protein